MSLEGRPSVQVYRMMSWCVYVLVLGTLLVCSVALRIAAPSLGCRPYSLYGRNSALLTRLAAGKVGNSLQKAQILPESMQAIRDQEYERYPLADDPLLPMVLEIARSADARKSPDVLALRVGHLTEIAQFLVIVEGNSNRQIKAIADTVEDDIQERFNMKPYVKDGTALSGWSVLDYGSVLVHIMSPPMRSFYKLEKRYAKGEVVDLSSVLTRRTESVEDGYDDVMADGMIEQVTQSGIDSGDTGKSSRGSALDVVSAEDLAFWGSEDIAMAQNAMLSAKTSKQRQHKLPSREAEGALGSTRWTPGSRQRTSGMAGSSSSSSKRSGGSQKMRLTSGRDPEGNRRPPARNGRDGRSDTVPPL